jgi:hypothetical protein
MPALRLAIGLAAVICLTALCSPAQAADPGPKVRRGVFGLTSWTFPTEPEVRSVSRRGLRHWRVILAWGDIERSRGNYNWSGFDRLVAQLNSRHVEVVFLLAGCPNWACHRGGLGPPRTGSATSAWLRFVHHAVQRYGTVRYWQVMNEINGEDQWPHPSASAYAALLKRTAAAIRAADPSRLVVLGGLGEKMTIYLHPYLSDLYRQPGFARDFDVMGVEGYAPRPRNVARILRTTRRIMRRNGDLAKPVWITEMSWATAGGRHAFVTTKRGQARRLRRAYDMLLACRNRWNLQRVYWFAHRDRPRPAGALDYWGYHNGLLTLSGRWKPAMRSFLHYLRKRLPRRGHRTTCRRAARAAGRR